VPAPEAMQEKARGLQALWILQTYKNSKTRSIAESSGIIAFMVHLW
jgi:hypothetical protein